MGSDFWKQISSKKFPINGTPWTFSGYSVAAQNTIIIINELGIALDCGLETGQNPSHIFVSHTHFDHVKAAPQYVIDPPNKKIPIIVIPKPSAQNFKSFVSSAIAMTKHEAKFSVKMQIMEVSLQPKQKSVILSDILTVKNIKFRIEIIKCSHSTPTTGYGFIEIRSKLKDEYKGLPQNELDALKKSGIQICHDIQIPHFCYLGDTDHKVLGDPAPNVIGGYYAYNECLEKYPNVFVECTFFDPDDLTQAKHTKHMHWAWLGPYIRDHPDTHFNLYHFSMRYKPKQITEFFSQTGMSNITPLVHDFDEIYMTCVMNLIKSGKFSLQQLESLSSLLPARHPDDHDMCGDDMCGDDMCDDHVDQIDDVQTESEEIHFTPGVSPDIDDHDSVSNDGSL